MKQQSDLLKALKKEDVQASAQKYLPADKMYIVVVGDRAKAFPGITELGYEVVELDTDGNRVAAAATSTATPASVMPSPDTEKVKVVTKTAKGKKEKRKAKRDKDKD